MDNECLELIKDIGKYDIFLGMLITMILFPLFKGGAGLFLIGTVCSFINFIINSYANNGLKNIENIYNVIFFIASYVVRIGLVCSISILLILKRDVFFYIFITGYSAQVISILLYGAKLRIKEGV